MKILSVHQIREWDDYSIQHQGISSLDLMEKAAAKCTDWLLQTFTPDKAFKIFCGKGNNGGDGLVIARQLADKKIFADVYILEFGSAGTPDFQANLSRLHSYPVRIHFIQEKGFLPNINNTDLVVDALLGTGLKKSLDGLYADTVAHINNNKATVVSIDLPTGLYADKVINDSIIIMAAYTLTFQVLKLSFLLPQNEKYLGEIIVLNINLDQKYLSGIHPIYQITDDEIISDLYKPRKQFSHKGTYGHALIIAGEKGKMGAAVLCAKACLRSGVGLATAVIPQEQFIVMQVAVSEAMVMSHEDLPSTDFSKYACIGIGPGIGTSMEGIFLLQTVLAHFNNPIILDADALNILAKNPDLLNELPPGSILTPHPKEFERLFGISKNDIERLHTARYYAQKLFVYIILKGHYSAVACPDGEVYFNSTGNAGMATGGSGDVLTGILTSLVSQGYTAKDACILGMYIHGLSGDMAAIQQSQEALVAGEIVEYLGKSFLQLGSTYAKRKVC